MAVLLVFGGFVTWQMVTEPPALKLQGNFYVYVDRLSSRNVKATIWLLSGRGGRVDCRVTWGHPKGSTRILRDGRTSWHMNGDEFLHIVATSRSPIPKGRKLSLRCLQVDQ